MADSTITYQGQLTGPDGNVDGSADLSFELFDAKTDGNRVAGPLSRASTPVDDGLFQVELDFGSAVYANGPVYLQVSVDGDPLSPRQQITAAPLAVHALNAETTPTEPAWLLDGNSGTHPGFDFLGTTDETALVVRVDNTVGFRIEPGTEAGANQNEVVPNVIGGSHANTVSGVEGVVIAGGGAAGNVSPVLEHRVSAEFATIGGGIGNTITEGGWYATIAGGRHNIADAPRIAISGGFENEAFGSGSTIGGGIRNATENLYSTVPGGAFNEALGHFSFAAGLRAQSHHQGAFVWADGINEEFQSTAENEFAIRATGGVRLVVGDTTCQLSSGDSAFDCTVTSDRNAKTDLEAVSGAEALEQVAGLELYRWRYGHDPADKRHLGPMAQDFADHFGLGDDPTRIRALDVAGVALAAIQGLHERAERLEAENARLRERLDEMAEQQAAVNELAERLARLENALIEDRQVAEVSE